MILLYLYMLPDASIGGDKLAAISSLIHIAKYEHKGIKSKQRLVGRDVRVREETIYKCQDTPGVSVTTDKQSYGYGDPILANISNQLLIVIYASLDRGSCAVVSVQRLEAGQWETVEPCAADGPVFFIPVVPRSEIRGVLSPAARDSGAQGPAVSAPVAPGVFQKDLRTLPRDEAWKPGDPIREVPRGGPASQGVRLRFSPLDGRLGAGTYRLVFRFRLGKISEPVQIVYSNTFVVMD
jgi:hypothetical protein